MSSSKNYSLNSPPYPHLFFFVCIIFLILMFARSQPANGASTQTNSTSATPTWLEPRSISIVHAVGELPESILNGIVLKFTSFGIVEYVSGARDGDKVTLTVKNDFDNPQLIDCLGSPGHNDEFPAIVPEATMRVFSGTTDVTNRVFGSFSYYPAGQLLPERGAGNTPRYDQVTELTSFDATGRVIIPANMGCRFTLSTSPAPLENGVTVEFEFNSKRRVAMTLVNYKDSTRSSYIHPTSVSGALGKYSDLNQELHTYNNQYNSSNGTVQRLPDIFDLPAWGRNDAVNMNLSDVMDADYALIKYPEVPFHGFVDQPANTSNPIKGGGSHRLNSGAPDFKPSVDHVTAGLYPIFANWIDADRAAGDTFLEEFGRARTITIPEIVAPPGLPYDPCMPNGAPACSNSILHDIFTHSFAYEVYFIKVERIAGGLVQIPLKAVGPSWSPTRDVAELQTVDLEIAQDFARTVTNKVYLPLLSNPEVILPDSPNANCPCGWFDSDGTMFDIVLAP